MVSIDVPAFRKIDTAADAQEPIELLDDLVNQIMNVRDAEGKSAGAADRREVILRGIIASAT
ncbi:hypothetical protein D9M72_632300 [compost metagenome]